MPRKGTAIVARSYRRESANAPEGDIVKTDFFASASLLTAQNFKGLRMLNVSTRISLRTSYVKIVASLHSARAPIRQLEVERKYLATPVAISYLRSNGEGSTFKLHESLGKQTARDTYYDQAGLLFSKGVYVRRRNGRWEAKIRTGGDYINSAFTEIEGMEAVKQVVEQHLAISVDAGGIEEILKPCADFVTNRESWMLDQKFRVDVDTTDFGHTVGEVELTKTLQCANQKDGEETEQERAWKTKMDQEIEAFMQTYPRAFPAGKPLGKLSAYFSMANRET